MSVLDKDIQSMLLRGEQVLFKANQSRFKPGGSKLTPNTVYVTNQRIMFRNPKLFGLKKDYIDVFYRDINQIRLKKGVFSTEIQVSSRFQDSPIILPAVDKKDAEQIGGYIRKGIEKQLPGQNISDISSSPKIIETTQVEDPIKQLEKLGNLKEAGIISEEEFKKKKKELLEKI